MTYTQDVLSGRTKIRCIDDIQELQASDKRNLAGCCGLNYPKCRNYSHGLTRDNATFARNNVATGWNMVQPRPGTAGGCLTMFAISVSPNMIHAPLQRCLPPHSTRFFPPVTQTHASTACKLVHLANSPWPDTGRHPAVQS